MERPYFVWDYAISEEQIWAILRGADEFRKTWLIGRIVQYARWDDIWSYLTLDDVRQHFDQIAWRFPFMKEMWAHTLAVWSQEAGEPSLRERPSAYAFFPDRKPQLFEGILTPLQRSSLVQFFANPIGPRFWLTGGTALAAFYFGHRCSDDLDLFTLEPDALDHARREMRGIAEVLQCTLTTGLSTPTFQQFYLAKLDGPPLKLDLVRDFGPQYGERRTADGIVVDSLSNIAANKVTAIFGRTEVKDFVDLYYLLRSGYELKTLIAWAKQKDLGVSELYLGYSMRQVARFTTLPTMLSPMSLEELRGFLSWAGRRAVAGDQPSPTTFPSSTVISTRVFVISIGATLKISCPSTTRSAILPGVMLPR